MDIRLEKGEKILLPEPFSPNPAFLFYVFDGAINVNDRILLNTGESSIIENENPTFSAVETSDIILFITEPDATHYDEGMYSGNLLS